MVKLGRSPCMVLWELLYRRVAREEWTREGGRGRKRTESNCLVQERTRTWLNTSVSETREGQLQSIHKQLCNDHYNLHLVIRPPNRLSRSYSRVVCACISFAFSPVRGLQSFATSYLNST